MSAERPEKAFINRGFAAALESIVAQPWQEFAATALSPDVQRFCAYEGTYLDAAEDAVHIDLKTLDFVTFKPEVESFTPEEAATSLERTNRRIDTFLQGIMQVYCGQKGMAVPELSDARATNETLARMLVGGMDKIYTYMHRTLEHEDETLHLADDEQFAYLPATLLLVGARLRAADYYDELDAGVWSR